MQYNLINAGLVLEGGGLRGVFTAGVLRRLMDEGLWFSSVYGVSMLPAIFVVDRDAVMGFESHQAATQECRPHQVRTSRSFHGGSSPLTMPRLGTAP